MIITVTLNPAIDYSISNKETSFDIGGKGINVSKTLKVLNKDSFCIGFVGKDNKELLYDYLDEEKIGYHFIEVEGKIRTNTKRIIDNELYEENEEGPYVSDDKVDELLEMIKQFKNEIVVISGSVSKNVDRNIYARMTRILKQNNNYVIVDCDKELLKNVVKEKPDMIKPNIKEVCNLFDCEYDEKIIIDKIRQSGLDNVLISKGKDGAILASDRIYASKALNVNYCNALSAGDAMVAAFAYGISKNMYIIDVFKLSVACSAATVETKGSKPADIKRIKELLNSVSVEIMDDLQ